MVTDTLLRLLVSCQIKRETSKFIYYTTVSEKQKSIQKWKNQKTNKKTMFNLCTKSKNLIQSKYRLYCFLFCKLNVELWHTEISRCMSAVWLLFCPAIETRYTGWWCSVVGWWCSGIVSGLPHRRSGVQIPDPPTLEKCAKGICLCNLLRSTQPNDRETVIEG